MFPVVRAERQWFVRNSNYNQHPSLIIRRQFPIHLGGSGNVDDAEGRASCRKYWTTDAATIERTGQDPLIGAMVISRQIVHRYSEYGDGDFFVVSKAAKEREGVWTLSGHVFVDSLPGEGERGAEVSERFELSMSGAVLSSSEAVSQTYFRCDKVRPDLHGAKEIIFFEKVKDLLCLKRQITVPERGHKHLDGTVASSMKTPRYRT